MSPSRLASIVEQVRQFAAMDPRELYAGGGMCASSVEPPIPVDRGELENELQATLPEDLLELYRLIGGMDVFRDVEASMWGLRVFSPREILTEGIDKMSLVPENFRKGDIVFAKTYGDDRWFLVRGDRAAGDFGTVVFVPEMDMRGDWPTIAPSVTSFLEQYVSSRGSPGWPDWANEGQALY